jgi:drug/metabolite transporter (DMT)-like permease
MRPSDYARLFALAAIWGGSFIFMRVLAPALGAFATADLRVLIGGLVLALYARLIGLNANWREHWRHYVVIGLLYSGVPFILFAFAALHLPASYSAIINSLTPLFAAVFAAWWLSERLTGGKVAGLVLGIAGVALVAWRGGAPHDPMMPWAVLACVGATICYGLAGAYTKKYASHVRSLAIATFSQLASGLVLLPLAIARPPTGPYNVTIALNLLGLAVLCSAVAFVLFYRLIADVGPTRAMTVTFLVPGFGMLWGVLFLGEHVSLTMLAGFALIIAGTLAVGGTLKSLFRPRRALA